MMATKVEIDWPQELERLAREAEKDALAKAEEIFAEAVAEHERQTAGYSFRCRRWGDFLTVSIERKANEKDWWRQDPERKTATSLNIGRAQEIKLFEGHCFDRRGRLTYRASIVSDDGSGSGWGTGAGRSPPWKGHHYEVTPQYPVIPKARAMVVVEVGSRQHSNTMWDGRENQPRYVTENYPRPAEDDAIRFQGIGATIYAPAGKGLAVYKKIMAEIARGYEPPEQAK